MTVWNEIEEALNRIPVKIRLTAREAIAVREAQEWWTERTLNESSAWAALQVLSEMPSFKQRPGTGAGTKAVKGLDSREVQLIRHIKPNAKTKQGNTGEVVALAPQDWLRIAQEIERQPEYYDKQVLGNITSSAGLAKKIRDQIAGEMGQKPAGAAAPAPEEDPSLTGKPSDITPSVQGSAQYGHPAAPQAAPKAAPAKDDAAARRARVRAQDMATMGARSKKDVDRMTRSGKMKVDSLQREEVSPEGVLNKKTSYGTSISLEEDEWKALERGEIQKINVTGMDGKRIVASIPGQALWQAIKTGKAHAGLRQLKDDPTQKTYFFVDIRRFMHR